MPLPNPKKNEKRQDFVSRCMSSKAVKNEFGEGTEQAQAVCFKQWRNSKKKNKK